MKVVQTKDTISNTCSGAVRIRCQIFIAERGAPLSQEVDRNKAHYIHFVLYSDKKEPRGTVCFLPLEDGKMKL